MTNPLIRGTVDLLILKALSWGPRHGFGISAWLESQSAGSVVMDDSALYQALHKLEARELVEARWKTTDNNRQARCYRLTSAGRAHLRSATEAWLRSSHGVTHILTLTRPATD